MVHRNAPSHVPFTTSIFGCQILKRSKKSTSYRHPGQGLLGDFPPKPHTGAIHKHVRPNYLQIEKSPTELLRSAIPSKRQGRDETLADPYYHRDPLPSIQGYQVLNRQVQLAHSASSTPSID